MESLEEFEAALDADPTDFDTFKEGAVMLTRREDWAALEAYYRHQLRRIDGDAEAAIKRKLWFQLGQIYELRLDRPESAEQAYQVALSTDPDNAEIARRLDAVQQKLPE